MLKHFAFSQFYKYLPLAQITDQTVELEKALAPNIGKMQELSFAELNAFFLKRLHAPKQDLFTIVKCIKEERANGELDWCILEEDMHFDN